MAETDLVFVPRGGQGTIDIEELRDAIRARGLRCHLKRYDNAPEVPWLIFEKEYLTLRFVAAGNAATRATLEVVLDDASLAAGLPDTLDTLELVFTQMGWEAGAAPNL